MDSTITKQLEKQFANKVMKEINLDALAKKIAPSVEKELKASILRAVKESPMENYLYDALGKDFWKALEASMVRAISKLK